jgi:hypothetical protein
MGRLRGFISHKMPEAAARLGGPARRTALAG